jgi:hypothetical protein
VLYVQSVGLSQVGVERVLLEELLFAHDALKPGGLAALVPHMARQVSLVLVALAAVLAEVPLVHAFQILKKT